MVLPVRFSGRLWLNGEFGVSRQREALFNGKSENDYRCPIHYPVMLSLIADWGVMDVLKWVLRDKGSDALEALGSSNVPKSHTARKRRGEGGITPHGRKMLRNAATLMERENGKHRLSFLTLTIPNCTWAEYADVVRAWSEVTRQFLQDLRRRLVKQGLEGEVLSCTEIQEERYSAGGIPALHLHCVFVGKSRGKASWAVVPAWVRKRWKSILSPYCPSVSDWRACENLRRVQKSASAYLGKYMSKGTQAVQSLKDNGQAHLLPSAWWNCSFSLRRRVFSQTVVGYRIGEVLTNLIDSGKAHWFKWLHPIVLSFKDGGSFRVGWSGKLHDWAYRILKSENDAAIDMHGKISLLFTSTLQGDFRTWLGSVLMGVGCNLDSRVLTWLWFATLTSAVEV